jgi:hypothetical protein
MLYYHKQENIVTRL